MKIKLTAALSGLFLLFLFSCSKELSYEKSTGSSGNTSPGIFQASVDGTQWVAVDSTINVSILAGVINITGISSDNKLMNITLAGQTTGIYQVNQNTISFASFNEISNGAIVASYSTDQSSDTANAGGEVTVTDIDTVHKTISGTFYFNVFNSDSNSRKVISEGVFTQLPYSGSLPPANGTDSFYVTIDGTYWAAPSIGSEVVTGQLYVQGSSLDGTKSVGLYMPQNVSPGTYTLDFSTGTYIGQYSPNASTILISQGNGTLTVLENNTSTKRIRANFAFVASDLDSTQSSTLTSGYLSVQY